MVSFVVKKCRPSFLAAFAVAGLLVSNYCQALSCSELRQLTLLYFKMHFSHNKFDDEISSRTLESFIKAWDPWKLYFYQKDVEEFRDKYKTKLDDMIQGNLDCSAVDFVMNRYTVRLKERHSYVTKLIDHKKFDFTIDEYMSVDRKAMDYASKPSEIDERWRKRIKFQLLNLKTGVGDIKKAKEKLKKRYSLALKRHEELTKDRVLGIFLNSFSSSLDPHSSYMPAEELEDFRIRTRLSLEGIGATLRSEDGFTIVVSLVKGGAAKKGGLLKVNDKIIAVAQGDGEPVDVINMDLQDVVQKIRGARGTTVKLTVMRETSNRTQKPIIIPIIREKIQLVEQQASSKVVKIVQNDKKEIKVGVLTLPSFYIDFEGRQKRLSNYRSSSNDAKREIKKLQQEKIDALIVDLRNNGGGSLEESINMAGIFFDQGPVVQIRTGDGDVETYHDRDGKTFYDGPLVVMINRHSASASEIFAGAIQDYKRGIIVGDHHTFGKGTVQNLNDLAPQLGAIKVTVNQFYRASGASTQLEGVAADIVMPSLVEQLEIGEKYYDYALPYEKIRSAKYEAFKMSPTIVESLKQRSVERVKKNKDFMEIEEEIQKFKKNKNERSRVSLQEKKEKAEEEKKEEEAGDSDDEYQLKDDVYLQEALKITADYSLILNGKKLKQASHPVIPEVQKAQKQASLKKKKSKK